MSHLRRVQGRFITTASSEALSRQLSAPVHKWKKQWVIPSGLQPESSYKICKWVRISERVSFSSINYWFLTETEKADFADQDEGNDQDDVLEDDEQDADPEEGEGDDGADEAGEDGTKPSSPSGEAPIPATGPTLVTPTIVINGTSAPASDPEPTANPASNDIEVDAPRHPHDTPLPSNAVELTNTAPLHTETGAGDLGLGGGVELKSPELGGPASVEQAEKMDVDAAAGNAEAEPTEEKDPGLVMGEMEAPVEVMEVEGEKKEGPPEAE